MIKNQLDGLDVYVAGSATLNYVFDRYMSTKYDLRRTTRSNYLYMYDHFVREGFGQRKIGEIKYSDVMYFCLLYTSDAADDLLCVDLGGRRIINKKNKKKKQQHVR